MCGIAGILRVHPPGTPPPPAAAIPETWLDILDESIKHRGPDGHGRFRDRATRPDGSTVDIALVHRRLAIIDPACGHQPMVWAGKGAPSASSGTPACLPRPGLMTIAEREAYTRSPDGAGARNPELALGAPSDLIAVVFNGCIYNHRELRRELERAGHVFETDHSDTEVLVHGWREWGPGLSDRLDGMFAIAIWDHGAASCCMMRDDAGEKPLYEVLSPHDPTLVFGSSAATVIRGAQAANVQQATHVSAFELKDWVRFGHGNCQLPPTAWVHEVMPGERRTFGVPGHEFRPDAVVIDTARARPRRADKPSLDVDRLDSLLRRAVASCLETDVPLGCFLSGGVDSSLICQFAKEHVPSLHTLSVRMPDARYDESAAAERVATILKTRHQTIECDAHPANDLELLVRQLGLPFGDSSLLPTYWLSKACRAHFKVALAGDGADELFGGYDRYRANRLLQSKSGLLALLPVFRDTGSHPRARTTRLARLVDAARHGGYRDLVSIFPAMDLCALFPGHAEPRGYASRDPLLDDFGGYLPGDILRKTDTASMAVALETRAPYLTREVVQAALAEPLSSLMPRGQRKGLLRQVARKYLPAEIVDRPKQGFAIPIGEWFRTDYGGMKQLLMDHLNSAEPWGPSSFGIDLNMTFVRQMVDEHMSKKRDHAQRLYMLLVLSIWAKWLGKL